MGFSPINLHRDAKSKCRGHEYYQSNHLTKTDAVLASKCLK
jgi:hypothetical protein